MTARKTFTSNYFPHSQIKLEKVTRCALSPHCSPWSLSYHGVHHRDELWWAQSPFCGPRFTASDEDSSLPCIVAQAATVSCVKWAINHAALCKVTNSLSFTCGCWAPVTEVTMKFKISSLDIWIQRFSRDDWEIHSSQGWCCKFSIWTDRYCSPVYQQEWGK